MSLRISGKHMDIGDALRGKIEDRVSDAVEKYFGGGFTGHVNMEKQTSGFQADCVVHLDSGIQLQAKGTAADAHASFDAAADRIEKRLRRYKRRLKDHRGDASGRDFQDAAYTVMAPPEAEEEVAEDYAPAIIAESTTTVGTQTVAMAVMQLDLKDEPVHIFKNAANGSVNIVYRRGDGNIGWIDPSKISSK